MNVVLWMIGTLASFSLMAVGVRELSGELSIFQMLFIRSLIGLIVISTIIAVKGEWRLFSTERLTLNIGRNVFHFAGQCGWFLGIALLPLAEVFALEFTVPIWAAIIAGLFLMEKITRLKIVSLVLGIAGVLVIVQPGVEIIDPASFIVLAAAVCFAISHMATKSLSSSESPLTILYFMSLVQLPISLIFSLNHWQTPNLIQTFWLTVIGLTALTAHFCITKAMQSAEATAVLTLDFLRLPLISLVGVLLYNESFEVSIILGALLMLMGNVLNLYQQQAVYRKNR